MDDGSREGMPGYDVFVSYSRNDEALADRLNGWLAGQNLRTFFDRHELAVGLPWIPALEQAIAASGAVAILVGPQGIGNTQQYEVELALKRQTADRTFPVIPVLLPGCEHPPVGFLELLTWADLRPGSTLLDCPAELQALLAAIRREPTSSAAIRGTICPYMGLEAFREEDSPFFCGRDAVIDDLVAKTREHAFVAVVGRSGSGKSSVVEAGLLPALRRQYRTTVWDSVVLKPGAWPLQSLAGCFNAGAPDAGVFAADAAREGEVAALRQGPPTALARVIAQRLAAQPERPDRLLIRVDQWEELYSRAPSVEQAEARAQHEADVTRFVDLLIAATEAQGAQANVVITVRIDFYGQLMRHPGIAALLPRQQVNLGTMSRDDLRTAIVRPADKVGLRFTPPALVDQILDDVGQDERMLPLLQYALKETWSRREQDALTATGYAAAGGVRTAIQNTAQLTFDKLSAAEQTAAKRLFLGLVIPGEGQEDTRTQALIPDDALVRQVVEKFADRKARLLVTGSEAMPGEVGASAGQRATVEMAHEALIRSWPMLQTWVRESRDKLRSRAAMRQAMRQWEENGKREDLLLQPGFQLERGRDLLDHPGEVPVEDLRAYIERSIARDAAQVARERAELRRKARSRTILLVSAMVVALISSALAVAAFLEERSAVAQRDEAQANWLWSRLDFNDPQGSLSEGDVNGLWDLAAAPQAVQTLFVNDLRRDPAAYATHLRHASPVFAALRLTRGSPQVSNLLGIFLDALKAQTPDPDVTAGILEVLGPSLTGEQAAQAFTALLPYLQPIGDSSPAYFQMEYTIEVGDWVPDDMAEKLLPIGLADLQAPQDPVRWARGLAELGAAEGKPEETLAALDWCVDALAAKTIELNRMGTLAIGIATIAKGATPAIAGHVLDGVVKTVLLLRGMEDRPTGNYDVVMKMRNLVAALLTGFGPPLMGLADMVAPPDLVGSVAALVQAAGVMGGDSKTQSMLLEAARRLAARIEPQQALQVYNTIRTEVMSLPTSPDGVYGQSPEIFTGVMRAFIAKLSPADADRELASVMSQLTARLAAPRPPPVTAGGQPPGYPPLPDAPPMLSQREEALAFLAASLAGVAPPDGADRLVRALSSPAGPAPASWAAIYKLVAPRLSNPTASFDDAAEAIRNDTSTPDYYQTKPVPFGGQAAGVLEAVAGSLSPQVAAARIDVAVGLLEQQAPNSNQTRPISDGIIDIAAKIEPSKAAGVFDRLTADLERATNELSFAGLSEAAAAVGRRMAPDAADARLGSLVDALVTLPAYTSPDDANNGYVPARAYATAIRGLATVAGSDACAKALDVIMTKFTTSPPYDTRLALAQVAAGLTPGLDPDAKSHAKNQVLYALQRTRYAFEGDSWTTALVPILKAEPADQFVADVVTVWKFPNAQEGSMPILHAALHEAQHDSPDVKEGPGGLMEWVQKTYPKLDLHSPPHWIPTAQLTGGGPAAR